MVIMGKCTVTPMTGKKLMQCLPCTYYRNNNCVCIHRWHYKIYIIYM